MTKVRHTISITKAVIYYICEKLMDLLKDFETHHVFICSNLKFRKLES